MAKPTIVTRAGKGSALTWTEGDSNVTNLRDATISVTDGTTTKALNLNDTLTFTAGTNVSLSVNGTTGAVTINASQPTSVATLTTPRAIYGNSFDGSAALTQIIASTYGGTGNGFTKFTGPTTAERTFTLPDASSTILVSGGALGTPSSGTVTNLTGTASININGTVGATTATTGAFTTLSASTSVSFSPSGAITLNPTTAGTINNMSIGATTAAAGSFTTLAASSTVSGAGFSTYLASPPAIGGTSAAAGTFTTLTSTGRTVIKDLTETVATVTFAATITPNVANGTVQTVTLTGNVTFSAFASPVTGQSLTLIIVQDATGSRTLTSTMKFSGASKTLSTAANAIDIMTVFYDGTNYYASLAKGFA
jgi:hypothetical protein